MASKRLIMSSWQPASSGVTERRLMSSQASCKVGDSAEVLLLGISVITV